jgi:hypothetical protein
VRRSLDTRERRSGGHAYVARLRAFLALRDVVLDLLVILEVSVTLTRDRAEVHKHVCAAVLGSDESEALLRAEPFHGSSCHYDPSFLRRPGLGAAVRAAGVTAGAEGTARSEPRSVPSKQTVPGCSRLARPGAVTAGTEDEVGGMGVRRDGRPSLHEDERATG